MPLILLGEGELAIARIDSALANLKSKENHTALRDLPIESS